MAGMDIQAIATAAGVTVRVVERRLAVWHLDERLRALGLSTECADPARSERSGRALAATKARLLLAITRREAAGKPVQGARGVRAAAATSNARADQALRELMAEGKVLRHQERPVGAGAGRRAFYVAAPGRDPSVP
jgi:hypothetical protein